MNIFIRQLKKNMLLKKKKQIEIMKAYYNRARENYTYDYRKVDSPATSSFSAYKVAYDQPSGGTIFSTANSGFFWADSSRSPGTYSLGISIGGKTLSVSASYSPGTITGSG